MKTCESKIGLTQTSSGRLVARHSLQALLLGVAVGASSAAHAQVQENPFFATPTNKVADASRPTAVPHQARLNLPKTTAIEKPEPKKSEPQKPEPQKPEPQHPAPKQRPKRLPIVQKAKPNSQAALLATDPELPRSGKSDLKSNVVEPDTPLMTAGQVVPDTIPPAAKNDSVKQNEPAHTIPLAGTMTFPRLPSSAPVKTTPPAAQALPGLAPQQSSTWRPPSPIGAPARKVAARIDDASPVPVTWLQSTTPSSQRKHAIELLDRAMQEYTVGAWASAEASVWEALRSTAEGIDIAQRNAGLSERGAGVAMTDLQLARTALREARDFAGKYGDLDAEGVKRVIRSHSTTALKHEPAAVLATDAIDRYMNEARIRLSRLAAYHVEAAQAIDLLAAIHLGRNDTASLANETSLCLRRAALQGQPQNADLAARLGMQLADLGLDQEAKWALEHSLAIRPTEDAARTLTAVMQRGGQQTANRLTAQTVTRIPAKPTVAAVPQVTQLTPEQFAIVSPPVMAETAATVQANVQNLSQPQTQVISPASYRATGDGLGSDQSQGLDVQPKKSAAQRLLSPFKKFW